MIGKKNYEIIYTDPFIIKRTTPYIPQRIIGSNIIKWSEEEESSD